MSKPEDNPVLRLSIEFSIGVVNYCNHLESIRQFEIKKQLLKSATSVTANICEAQHPESRVDFIHKMKIAAKEAEESMYWLTLCNNMPQCNKPTEYMDVLIQVQKLLSVIIYKAKKNLKGN